MNDHTPDADGAEAVERDLLRIAADPDATPEDRLALLEYQLGVTMGHLSALLDLQELLRGRVEALEARAAVRPDLN